MDNDEKFHEDRKINVASRVLTRKNAPPPGSHVFQPTGIIFELRIIGPTDRHNGMKNDIIRMNLLTKFHEDWTVNVASRTNLLTKFHEDWTINVASRVLTRFYYSHNQPYKEKYPAPDIIGTNLLTKFHDDRKINVTSRENSAPPPPPAPRGGHVFQPTGIIF
ncbi:hypothetical protein DPMN_102356 [Dreissena polymorpha]|uniref:Uncharacterized protein n=1 Tax=Dreissena polymorpha TaxID=45954 RepID=A0A9D4LKT4_DREPO|nr:hypothetical protein DPMN_102356 [Dreissena polymorpha]